MRDGGESLSYQSNTDSAEKKEVFSIDKTFFLSMPPRELMEYIKHLRKNGQLDDFLDQVLADDSLKAHLSYWEKWFPGDIQKLIDTKVNEQDHEKLGTLPLQLETKFSPNELEFLMSHVAIVQLTFGCSVACPKCAVDAPAKVRSHIPYDQLEEMFKKYGGLMKSNEPFLYKASDPYDYENDGKTYQDVHDMVIEQAGYKPHVTTAVDENTDKDWVDYVNKSGQVTNPRISRWAPANRRAQEAKGNSAFSGGGGLYSIAGHTRGMGVDTLSGTKADKGIGCRNGVIITPRGLYGIIQVSGISDALPQGQIVGPIESVTNYPPKIGESIYSVLSRGVLHKTEESFSGGFRRILRLETINGSKFDVVLDADLKIAGINTIENDVDLYEKIKLARTMTGADREREKAEIAGLYELKRNLRNASTEWKLCDKTVFNFLQANRKGNPSDLNQKLISRIIDGEEGEKVYFKIGDRTVLCLRPDPEWIQRNGNQEKLVELAKTCKDDKITIDFLGKLKIKNIKDVSDCIVKAERVLACNELYISLHSNERFDEVEFTM